jgi:site-specific DNA-methyltransferase (adenine-specific)
MTTPTIQVVCGDVASVGISMTPKLIIADPPYNLGMAYDAYEDKRPLAAYLAWTRQWLSRMSEIAHPHASLWVFMSALLTSEVDVIAKSLGWRQRATVCWYYTFGNNTPKNFTPSHTNILYYTKHKTKFTFNADAIKVPSARQAKYKDKRAKAGGRLPDDTWILFPEQLPDGFDPAGDVWLQSRVCGTFKAREAVSPNQLPLPIVQRIIRVCSDEGDPVLDPFCGTGTTAVACQQLSRECWTCDISEACVTATQSRLQIGAVK